MLYSWKVPGFNVEVCKAQESQPLSQMQAANAKLQQSLLSGRFCEMVLFICRNRELLMRCYSYLFNVRASEMEGSSSNRGSLHARCGER